MVLLGFPMVDSSETRMLLIVLTEFPDGVDKHAVLRRSTSTTAQEPTMVLLEHDVRLKRQKNSFLIGKDR